MVRRILLFDYYGNGIIKGISLYGSPVKKKDSGKKFEIS